MIVPKRGDILGAEADALVNTVNCVGVMGRGIALQFKKAFPENFREYASACERGEVKPGSMLIYETGMLAGPRFIINFPTKRHWKGKSRMDDIDDGLMALVTEVTKRKIGTVAIPPLGCGLGGLRWSEVRPRIVEAFSALPDVRVLLYEPDGAPVAAEMAKAAVVPAMTPGRAVLIELIRRYLRAVMDPFITLLEIHKLLYFTQEAGEGLRLRYVKAAYGPYAENLRHLLTLVEGHYISGYGDAADDPDKPIELVTGVADAAHQFIAKHPDTQVRFDRVAKLIHGFETPYGMELLATVHWVCTREGAVTLEEAIERTYAWNERKREFEKGQIELAYDELMNQGWLGAAGTVVGR